jgi:hypothetical protein
MPLASRPSYDARADQLPRWFALDCIVRATSWSDHPALTVASVSHLYVYISPVLLKLWSLIQHHSAEASSTDSSGNANSSPTDEQAI